MTRLYRLCALVLVLLIGIAALAYSSRNRQLHRERIAQARQFLEQNEPELARFTLRPLVDAGKQDGELFLLSAKALRLQGEPERAMQFLEQATAAGYETHETDLERGLTWAALGRYAEAESVLVGSPTREAAATLAVIHLQLYEREKALHNLDTWKELASDDPRPWFLSGTVWARVREHEKAVEEFRQALERQSDYHDARIQLALSLIELGETAEAAERLRECLDARPNDTLAAVRLAVCEIELGNSMSARTLLAPAVEDAMHGVEALLQLAKIELDEGNAPRAEKLLSEAMRRGPANESVLYNHSLALVRLGREKEAEESIKRSREIQESRRRIADLMDLVNASPSDLGARCEAAEQLVELGDMDQAAELLSAVLARDPENERALAAMKLLR